MDTLVGGMEYRPDLMGWYYRTSTDSYEFWWCGCEPMITLAAYMVDIMPTEIVMEIKASVTIKQALD